MPRAPWRRRRGSGSPRPAGRLAGPLRRGGTLARKALLIRVGRGRRGATVVRPASHDDFAAITGALGSTGDVARLVPTSPAVPTIAGGPPPGSLAIPLLPGERTASRRFRFAVVQGCTLAGLSLGVFAIFLAMNGHIRWAAVCLIAYAIFDGLDGALSRRFGVSSPFGAQLDSLVDMSSTGIAAPVVVYASLAGTVPTAAAAVTAALVAAGAAIRLARFNVSPKDGRFFCGVPTTMAAAMLALAVLLGLPLPGFAMLVGVVVLAFAMVSSFPYAKLARLVKLPPWLLILPIVGALVDIRVTFALAVLAYLASGPLLWLRRRAA